MSNKARRSARKPKKKQGLDAQKIIPFTCGGLDNPASEYRLDYKTGKLLLKDLEPTRPIQAVLKDRVTFLDDYIGLKLHEDTTLPESLQIVGYMVELGEHVQFLIGDAINFGYTKWGDKYKHAMWQTGRANSTLRQYASVAQRIPAQRRKASLSFWHHEVIVRMSEQIAVDKLLSEAAAQAEKGEPPSVKQLRDTVAERMPAAKAKLAEQKQREEAEIPKPFRTKRKHKSLQRELAQKRLDRQLMHGQMKIDKELTEAIRRISLQQKEAWLGFGDKLITRGKALIEQGERLGATTNNADENVDLQ